MVRKKFQSSNNSFNSDEESHSITYYGSKAEIESFKNNYILEELYPEGFLKTINMQQTSPLIYELELSFTLGKNGEIVANPPDDSYGKKSCTCRGSLISMPLESHPNYRTCWNHFLVASPDYKSGLPTNWDKVANLNIAETVDDKLAWIKSLSELPVIDGKRWRILTEPKKKGVNSYDLSTYTISEKAKFANPKSAGNFICNRLNKIGAPIETFGITGGDWKCDDTNIDWDGKNWVASLVWTKSGDNKGWDKDFYDNGGD